MKTKIRFRDPVSGWTHFASAILSFIGLIYMLIIGWPVLIKEISLFVYGISLILLFSASAAYHLSMGSAEHLMRLRKFDHTAIYALIAGSYTPICMIAFTGFWRWGFLAIIWSIALVGIIVKLFIIKAPRWITAGVYLLMGWISVLAVGEIGRTLSAGAIFWLFLGGIFYTVGAIIYITKKLDIIPGVFGFHEVWHIFVMLGAFSHFICIAVFLAPL